MLKITKLNFRLQRLNGSDGQTAEENEEMEVFLEQLDERILAMRASTSAPSLRFIVFNIAFEPATYWEISRVDGERLIQKLNPAKGAQIFPMES